MEKSSSTLNDLNLSIFKFFNKTFGKPDFDGIINFSGQYGGHHSFHYYLLIIFIIASFTLYSKKHDINALKELTISWFSAGITLFISLIIGFIVIKLIKDFSSVTRPYCNMKNIYILQSVTDKLTCEASFPSGHISFLTIMIASFWNLCNKYFKIILTIFITIVAISRMAAGAHYPIDLLGAIVITLPLTLYIQHKTQEFIRRYEKKGNIFDKIYNKITK